MVETIKKLIEALREELQQYGEMLSLLDKQQGQVSSPTHTWVPRISESINAQALKIQRARFRRDKFQQDLADSLKQPSGTNLQDLLPRISGQYRPLVAALFEETNHLLEEVQNKLEQNHLLLSRTLQTKPYHGAGIAKGTNG
jgi:gas vesicle protein